MTTSMRMRSGFSVLDFVIASSPFSAVTHWYPCLDSVSMKNCLSVGESSTIKILFTAMKTSSGTNRRVRAHCFQKTVLCEGLGEILVGAHHSAPGPVEQAVFGGQHDHRRARQARVLLDQRTGLIPVQTRHQNVHADYVGLMIRDFRQRVEAVFGEDHFAPRLKQENLG